MNWWNTVRIQITVELPSDIAAQAVEVNRNDPEFLSRVVLYGLTRRSIYRHLRSASAECICLDGKSDGDCPVHDRPQGVS